MKLKIGDMIIADCPLGMYEQIPTGVIVEVIDVHDGMISVAWEDVLVSSLCACESCDDHYKLILRPEYEDII